MSTTNISEFTKIRCGSKLHNGIEIPSNATIESGSLGREFYRSYIYTEANKDYCLIRYVDGKEPEFKTVLLSKM